MTTNKELDLPGFIRSELAKRKMTIAALADTLDVRRSAVDRALAGRQGITVGRLERWARAMGAKLEIRFR